VRVTRRRFLALGGAASASLAFPGLLRAAAPRYRSAPELDPPPVEVVVRADGTAPGLIFAACQAGPGQRGPMIVDDDGALVWFRPLDGLTAVNFSVQRYRGRPVLAWWEGQVEGGHGAGEYVLLDESYRELARFGAGNGLAGDFHELTLTPQGTALVTAYEEVPFDLSPVGGPVDGTLLDSVVQEVDVASGAVLLEWRGRDHVSLADTYAGVSKGSLDLAHLNSAALDSDGNLLVSARHTWAIYKVDRRSGEVLWQLGGRRSDFALGEGAAFYWQHHARRAPNGTLTVFDDGAGPVQEEPASRGISLILDEQARTATLAQEFVHPQGLLASALGSMESLPTGGAFVGWGSVPGFSEFGADGDLRLDAVFPDGGASYRVFRSAWSGRPSGRPSVAIVRTAQRPYAYVSWNGATAVTHWRLRTGALAHALTTSAVVARHGFETRVGLERSARFAAADALDRHGAVLASSAVLAV
jgi:hypothetical protein